MLIKLLLSAIALIPPATPADHPLDDVHYFNLLSADQQYASMTQACKDGNVDSLGFYLEYCKEDAVSPNRVEGLYKAASHVLSKEQSLSVEKVFQEKIKPTDREGLQVNYNPNIGPSLLFEKSGD